ncbi:MAG: hypothetical protein M1816_005472 [Peltula sp. TS41687]|nr:MAG: hypothetical protein M1816_005472 [Peltula sp. TS41687]
MPRLLLPTRLVLLRPHSSSSSSTLRVASPSPLPIRTIQSSAVRFTLKESRDKEGIEEDIEHHKQDLLKKQEEGKGHWKEELASESESVVKADRGDVKATPEDIKKLQDETVGKVNSGEKA